MKLTPIATVEKTVKRSFSFRQSTSTLLEDYQKAYEEKFGVSVEMKDLVEQMLLDFMRDDKDFQAKRKSARQPAKGGKPAGADENSKGERAQDADENGPAHEGGAAAAKGADDSAAGGQATYQ